MHPLARSLDHEAGGAHGFGMHSAAQPHHRQPVAITHLWIKAHKRNWASNILDPIFDLDKTAKTFAQEMLTGQLPEQNIQRDVALGQGHRHGTELVGQRATADDGGGTVALIHRSSNDAEYYMIPN